ncbi:MAG: S-methyl-5-thioribose-1-phosphate isomerase [Candidatus Thermoplasmatota archaeon]|jgi:translation initiation factor eIF-2B subunit alpha/methylthioribose-1-phosphate isomerase|nr:S-methyl-5-thioribose-1-phosphate isomerase [Candidatus Thermoplasmatota archaeon]MCL5789386.1 S-methyl-5-thioribose-1-phosphate isomerase [Candidatus Thermoplasmatota archaeon]
MKINLDGRVSNIKAVWYEEPVIKMIDQRILPDAFKVVDIKNTKELFDGIRNMTVRGAPSIGAAAAYGIAQAKALGMDLEEAGKIIKSARPTANDLFFAVDFVLEHKEDAKKYAEIYVDSIVERSRLIGVNGNELIGKNKKILTHCNAGALASVDYGTALSPIRMASESGKDPFVWVDETRPRLQGAKLTAWELVQEGIRHKVIADNAAGFLMERGEVDLAIVGADRITENGDFANKIGTYEKAVLAKENGVSFYVAAPLSTFDFDIKNGRGIPIEVRGEDEVKEVKGVQISPKESMAYNPAFDVTPNRYVTGYITEYGIFKSSDLHKLKGKGKESTIEQIGSVQKGI